MKRHLTTLAVLAATLTAPAAVAELTRVELTDPSKPVELRVEIEWGSIRVVGDSDASELVIEALADRPDEVASGLITVSENGNVVTVTQAPLKPGAFRSANLRIRTPLATSATLEMNRGGDIWVEGIRGLVEVTNRNGSVELAGISGAAAVNASNGSILAGLTEVDEERDMFFGSLNGSVELCLPPDFSARLSLTTAGDRIRSDFQVEREPTTSTVAAEETTTIDKTEVTGRIGSREGWLRASTLNGEIVLKHCE